MRQMFGNLSIRSKLIALLAVPVAGTALLGVAGVAASWGERARAAEERHLAAVAGQAAAAIHELQEERVRAVAWAAGAGSDGLQELTARRRRTDRALAAYRAGAAGLGPTGDPALGQAIAAADARLDRLAVVRAEADRRVLTPERTAAGHDAMVTALLVVARGLAGQLDAPEPARSARLLLALAAAKEATGQERTLLAAVPLQGEGPAAAAGRQPAAAGGRGASSPPVQLGTPSRATAKPGAPAGATAPAPVAAAGPLQRVRLAAAAAVARGELNGVRAAAGDRLDGIDRALAAPAVRDAGRLELALLEPATGQPAVGDLEPWRAGLAARAGVLRRVEREVAADLAGASAAWSARQQRRVRDQLMLAAGAALATLAAALLALRALAGARERPPAAGATLPGLARRGQALADRQLELLEDLARDEPDPLRREGLLGVDHLANRLRRTAETLLAMAGEPARQVTRPLPVAALLRAAVAEAEPGGSRRDGTMTGREPGQAGRGRRVDLLTTGEVEVEGPAGIDLVHLLAELLDNAAAFSPPAAPIVVTGAADGDGYLVEVTDRGLGMTDQELSWANQRLAGGHRHPAAAAGDRLGLTIAGRLAARNGFGVRLSRSPAGGVTAIVRLPAARLTTRSPAPVRPA
jgi:signal transduction histidine kinase